ncbi:MAG: glycoside hydrolase family 3 C-terminal domain-containing protein [Clostridia bacterium]|nr:glycoside hydrolase family 3 C-terminal domain-containing protein [Clostridia bacterium]
MKQKILTAVALAALCTGTAFSQPRLTKDNIDEVIAAMTNEEKALLLVGGHDSVTIDGTDYGCPFSACKAVGSTRAIERLGIPATFLTDGPAGARLSPTRPDSDGTYYATGFPVGTLAASSWDEALVGEMAEAIGNEVLEYGCDVLLAPGVNIHRSPLCGRNFEYYSEDPLLAGKIASAYIKGVQSNGVGTSIKHFAANSQETNRLENDALISQRALREIYLKNFEIAIKEARPWTVMSSYNKLNGNYTQQTYDLLTTVLRDEWGFDGIVMTDWGNKEGTVKSAKAGNDLMEPGYQNEVDRLLAAINDGTITEEEVNRNVRRMLEYIVRTPAFAKYAYSDHPDLEAHARIAREVADESIVLLRNEKQTLPLSGGEKVALYGVSSVDFIAGGTGSGNVNRPYVVNMEDALTGAGFTLDESLANYYRTYAEHFFAGLALDPKIGGRILLGSVKVPETPVPASAVWSEAKSNDVAVVVLGRNAGEGGDRKIPDDFDISNVERDLLRNVSAAFHAEGKKVIVILNVGGVIETNSWKNLADAIVLPWSPGQEGANAVADILTGKVNPSGRLPMTFPLSVWDNPSTKNFPYNYSGNAHPAKEPVRNVDYTDYEEGIYVGYRYFATAGAEVSYPFGYGLSYTTFVYDNPRVKATADGFTATVDVRNTGSVAGKEVVELYVAAPEGGLDKPAVELKGFAKTGLLQPGETQTVTISVDNYSLASFNEASSAWEAAAGNYEIYFSADVNSPKASSAYTLKKARDWPVNNVLARP